MKSCNLNSKKLTECLSTKITNQIRQYEPDEKNQTFKSRIHAARVEQNKQKLDVIHSHMNSEQLRTNDLNQETGASAWLTILQLKQEGYAHTKQLFCDLSRIRYGWQLSRTPKFFEFIYLFIYFNLSKVGTILGVTNKNQPAN